MKATQLEIEPGLLARSYRLLIDIDIWDVFRDEQKIGQVALHPWEQDWVVLNIYCHEKGVMRRLLPMLLDYYPALLSSVIVGGDTSPDAERMWRRLGAEERLCDYGTYFRITREQHRQSASAASPASSPAR